ncbi:hypothetical protein N657DRAFT_532786, partial [Parathielavia appendiculata]
VWAMIFKDAQWLEKATKAGLKPALFGYKLTNIYRKKKPVQAHLLLIVSDWSGDVRFDKEQLFRSLHKHEHNETTFEVHFESGIILNIHDPVTALEGIRVVDPEKYFHRDTTGLSSTVLYYNDRDLQKITP